MLPRVGIHADGLLLSVRVQPRAKANAVCGLVGENLKVRLTTPPVEGKANAALVAFMASVLCLRPRQVSIFRGETSREKVLLLQGLEEDELRARLDQILQDVEARQ